MADQRLADQASFKNQMSAVQNRKDMRQIQKKTIQDELETLRKKLQALDEEDATDNNKAMQLQSEYDGVTEQWRQTQQRWQDRLSAAISPQMVRIHLRYLAALISV